MATNATKRTATIQARVPPELDRDFKLAAQIDGRSASDAMRRCMMSYIAAVLGPGTTEAAPQERPRPANRQTNQ
jgi:hypothetical protein